MANERPNPFEGEIAKGTKRADLEARIGHLEDLIKQIEKGTAGITDPTLRGQAEAQLERPRTEVAQLRRDLESLKE